MPTTLPSVRASAGEAHDLGSSTVSVLSMELFEAQRGQVPERGVNVVASTVVDMSLNDSDEEGLEGSLASNRFAVSSDNSTEHAELEVSVPVRPRRRLVLVSQNPDAEVSDHEWDRDTDSWRCVRCGSGRRSSSNSPGNSR